MPMTKNDIARLMAAAEAIYDRVLAQAWLSYALIGALQIKVLWRIWPNRDLSIGDTSWYFRNASRWADSLQVNIVSSPLYTAFYGTVIAAAGDVTIATTFHRVL